MTGLTESQVYKWCWDQKKKVEDSPTKKKSSKAGLKDDKSNDKMQKKYNSKMNEIFNRKEEEANKENINTINF